jgi:hypothetical protein
MKITKTQLKKIIKEEMETVLNEEVGGLVNATLELLNARLGEIGDSVPEENVRQLKRDLEAAFRRARLLDPDLDFDAEA